MRDVGFEPLGMWGRRRHLWLAVKQKRERERERGKNKRLSVYTIYILYPFFYYLTFLG